LKEKQDNIEKPELSLVIPLYNEDESLRELNDQIDEALTPEFTYELIFVDDGSSDDSWAVIKKMAIDDSRIQGIRLRRNYGKSTALQCGFDVVEGNYVVTLDADLQDDPREIPEMIKMLKNGYDLVSGWKKIRHDPITKTVPSRFFNFVTSKVTGIELHDFNCGLKAYRRGIVDRIQLYGEMHRYIPLLASWEGYTRIGEKVVKHHPRKYGSTKFGLSRFMNGFLDLLTLMFVSNFLQKPMHFFGTIGLLLLIVGGGINGYLAFLKIFYHEPLSNRPLLFLGILLMVLGVQIFSTGFLGEIINQHNQKIKSPNIQEKI